MLFLCTVKRKQTCQTDKNITAMKKMIFALVTMLTTALSARAMSYEQARNEALFLTDKMAYELNLTDAQYEAAYEINLDYLMSVATADDVLGTYWERRNLDLSYILYTWQWDAFRAATYFYRPLYWNAGYWHFGIYARYPHRDYFYFGRPHFYATYRGGHSWHMNGGRSYYHGRVSHFRPSLPRGRSHFGMRDGFVRGDFRVGRSVSSTRVTGRYGRDNRSAIGRSGYADRSSVGRSYNNDHGSFNRSTDRSGVGRTNNNAHGSFNRSSGVTHGSSGRFGGSSINSGSHSSAGANRSSGGFSHSSGGASRSSGGFSRSSGGASRPSGGTSNSHGHFGGNRR
jgi:hypothetical protein